MHLFVFPQTEKKILQTEKSTYKTKQQQNKVSPTLAQHISPTASGKNSRYH